MGTSEAARSRYQVETASGELHRMVQDLEDRDWSLTAISVAAGLHENTVPTAMRRIREFGEALIDPYTWARVVELHTTVMAEDTPETMGQVERRRIRRAKKMMDQQRRLKRKAS
jgi:lambda repressor-like predicted transcriptional regulator